MDGPFSLHTSYLTDKYVDLTFSECFEQGAVAVRSCEESVPSAAFVGANQASMTAPAFIHLPLEKSAPGQVFLHGSLSPY